MIKRTPFRQLEELADNFDMMFDSDFGSKLLSTSIPRVDVSHTEDEVIVEIDVPGYSTEELDVTVEQNGRMVTVSGEREAEDESVEDEGDGEESKSYVWKERQTKAVKRKVPLPVEVSQEGSTASYSNGVLTVTLPKVQPEEPIQIDIE